MSEITDEQALDEAGIIEVGRAPNEVIADLWRQVLEDEGIVPLMRPVGAGPSFGSTAFSEYQVLVREDQAPRARAIIAELEEESDTAASGDPTS